METKRLEFIDFLKFLGLTGIIFVHAEPPEWGVFLRSFDVPLMVFVSAYLARKSYTRYKDMDNGGWKYIVSRFKRLVFPTWIFLTFFFVLEAAFGNVFSLKYYLESFGLTLYGIPFVWVILIYLYSALTVPLIDKLIVDRAASSDKPGIEKTCDDKVGGGKSVVWIVPALLYIAYEALYIAGLYRYSILANTIFYIIPFGIVTFLGYGYDSWTEKTKNILLVIFAAAFVISGAALWLKSGSFQSVSLYTFPPRIYYLTYGLTIIFLLMKVLPRSDASRIIANPVVSYISKHSMWIYLWHILSCKITEYLAGGLHWSLKFLIIYPGAILLAYAADKIVGWLRGKSKLTILKYLA